MTELGFVMYKLIAFVTVFFFSTVPLIANFSFDTKSEDKNQNDEEKNVNSYPLLTLGTNISGFPGEKYDWHAGYSWGMTYKIKDSNKLSIFIPVSYTMINSELKNLEGKTEPDFRGDVYKTVSDWQIKASFLEAQLLHAYKFFKTKSFDVSYILSPGLSIAVKDNSERIYSSTNELLETVDYGRSLDPETNALRSSFNLSTGLGFHISRLYLNCIYTFYRNNIKGISKLHSTTDLPYGLKKISKLNSISIMLSIEVFRH